MQLGEAVADRSQRLGDADAGHHVLALGVEEEVAVRDVLAGRGIAGERDAGARLVVPVAEHHRLDVHRGAEVVGDVLALAVGDRSCAVPRAEHRLHRRLQLGARVLRERSAGELPDRALVVAAQPLPCRGAELVRRPRRPRRAWPGRAPRRRAPGPGRGRPWRTSRAVGRRSSRRTGRRPRCGRGPSRCGRSDPGSSTVSIIPGMENFAPERTETNSGSSGSPRVRPIATSSRDRWRSSSASSPVGQPSCM